MFKKANPFFIHVLTPLHAGSGSELGAVDLPIQREKHTDYPKIEGSSLKGGIREAVEERCTTDELIKVQLVFGYDDDLPASQKEVVSKRFSEKNEFAGALGITDARILLFPVKSMKGVFVWIICPLVIERFKQDLDLCFGNSDSILPFSTPGRGKCYVSSEGVVIKNNVLLEEYAFEVNQSNEFTSFANNIARLTGVEEVKNRLVLLTNDDFKDFVTLSTEVITRTKISNTTGTVEQGALFTEEYLPSETILYSLALASPVFHDDESMKSLMRKDNKSEEECVMDFFKEKLPEVLQLGGNATLGKGIVRTKFHELKEN